MFLLEGDSFQIKLVNNEALKMMGKSEAEVKNKPLAENFPELGLILTQQNSLFTKGNSYDQKEVEFELTRLGKKCKCFFDLNFRPWLDSENKLKGIFGVCADVSNNVNERKNNEERERLYLAITKSTPDLIYAFDLNYRFIYANEALLKMWDKTWEESKGKNLLEIGYEPWHADMHEREIDQVIATKQPIRGHVIFHHATLGLRIYDYIFGPILDNNGQIEAISGTGRDITDLKQTEENLKESEGRFRNLADESPIFVFIVESEGKSTFSYWNKTWLEYTGLTLDKALGDAWKSTVHPDDLSLVSKGYESAYKNRQPIFISSVRIQNKYGEYRWFSFKANPRYLPDGSFIGYVGVGFDVHEQKLAETVLADREEKFRSLVQTLPQLVWVIDDRGELEFTSFRWKEFAGFEPKNIAEWNSIVHPDDFQSLNNVWTQSLATCSNYSHDVRLKSKSGAYRWFSMKGEPIQDTRKNTVKWVGSFTDIHSEKLFTQELELKVKERTEDLEKFNLELEQKNDELQAFAYVSSHDLQEPLRKIQIFASRIVDLDFDKLSAQGKDNFNRMQDAASRMQTLIQDLLAYSKTSSTEKKFELVDLSKLIEEIKDDFSDNLEEKGFLIEAHPIGFAEVIPFQFRQLFYNLFSNSLKFSNPNHTPHIQIKCERALGSYFENTRLSPNKRYLHISYSDNGIGFDPKYKEKIFEVFQRLHGRNEYKGTGIGLSIVKKIAENHGGFVEADGQLGQGARFDIYIPVRSSGS